MSVKRRIAADMTSAMKDGEKDRLAALRMLKAKIQVAEVELRREKGRDYEIDDDNALGALSSYAKQCMDSIESYERAGREDLAARERAELEIVRGYLPRQLDEEEVRGIVMQAIAEAHATSPKEMGAVMKIVMPKVKGAADGKLVNRLVRELLQGS
jgi:uncharacterized protein YqeY